MARSHTLEIPRDNSAVKPSVSYNANLQTLLSKVFFFFFFLHLKSAAMS